MSNAEIAALIAQGRAAQQAMADATSEVGYSDAAAQLSNTFDALAVLLAGPA